MDWCQPPTQAKRWNKTFGERWGLTSVQGLEKGQIVRQIERNGAEGLWKPSVG